ncbi:ABC transporter permease subunit [Modestobacter sp. I12A-02628]|uniref:ABC transporter permease subunit n=1 Tax=Goekera deserti TaxID=2497753 RepID=A0A7K3WDJ8_9ACTN|nr:ABC transporter permease subunit [Goekera deserti]MPQ97168.1 ABC transporter permease subunit [Goekera deserti]NDI46514.1 ABC transporter permease subunit [Goekera deserti]NEL54552.1 ABC transporter permease subunit [Goekera deserti]
MTVPVRTLSRLLTAAGVVVLIGVLPWLSGRSPELSILRARSAEQEATPEALAAVRAELGLDRGPAGLFGHWLGGLVHGDLGTSWVSGAPVGPGLLQATGVSLTLMGSALTVTVLVAAVLCAPALRRAVQGRPGRPAGVAGAGLTALPEFLLASVLLVVVAVWLGWLPPYGWDGPRSAVLPALAMGLPAGGLIGRLLADGLTVTSAERWVVAWQVAGASGPQLVRALLRRTLPVLTGQVALVLVGLTGGAVAVEQVFAVPGLGRATLGAAESQDLPTLQAGMLVLLLVSAAFAGLASLTRALLLGRALRSGSLSVAPPTSVWRRRDWLLPGTCLVLLAGIVAAGIGRDPYATVHGRLTAPGWDLPFGADASGRDLLARVAHGAVDTLGTAAVVTVLSLLIGVLVGLLPRASAGPIEVANAAPPVIVGVLVAAVAGSSLVGAAVAVTLVSWAPIAAHVAAASTEVRRQPHVLVLPVLGLGPAAVTWRHVLPAVLGPVARNAALRLPGIALALASLGFLGLGPTPPTPEWGLLLAEGLPYVERAPWAVLAPTVALVAASLLAVSLSGLSRRRPRPRVAVPVDGPPAPADVPAADLFVSGAPVAGGR